MKNDTEKLLLKIESLNVSFYSKIRNMFYFILRDINIDLYNAKKIAIVGESGSGKTTLANSILLLNDERITKYSGNIIFYSAKNCCNGSYNILSTVETEKILNIQHIRGYHISMIFQDPFNALNPVVCVGEQVEEVIKIHSPDLTKKELYDKTLDLFKKVKLPEPEIIYKKYPYQLSGGQLQRVCISVALANNPEIIIADEPTTALDASLRDEILNLLTELVTKEGSSLILITHDINLIRQYVDFVYVLYAGEIVEYGLAKQIFYNPLHPYTQMLLSCYPDKSKKGKRLPTIPSELPDLFDYNFVFGKCIFVNRCEKKFSRCETKPHINFVNGQYVKCFLYEK
ncbi:MAG: ABC transporter ATP-binding protein [Endomicrobia bacterium]|nr:ABC transporter ATP-binding protein [Endomicrobiia bacterium]MDW8055301.1 ABC transporter ATP-binding protein [Elusimicrobiota bacterium]